MKWQELPSLHSQSFSDLSDDSWYCFLQIKIKIMLKNYNHCEWFNIIINCYWQHTIFMPKLSNVEMLKTTWNVINKNSIKRYSLMSYLFVHLMRFTARKKQTECLCSVNVTHLSGPTVTFASFQIHTIRQLILSLQQARSVWSLWVQASKKQRKLSPTESFFILFNIFNLLLFYLSHLTLHLNLYFIYCFKCSIHYSRIIHVILSNWCLSVVSDFLGNQTI